MSRFSLHELALEPSVLLAGLRHPGCGGYVTFEGAVRDHNEGRKVLRLEYEAFAPLAIREGERILAEACARFGLEHARCAHRIGQLAIGELAVWVGVGAGHRGEAFEACRYIIDHVKQRVPIWKKEHYQDGDSGWVNCEACAAPHAHADALAHQHT
jgi:molybdopterin synthase catalytic subunit